MSESAARFLPTLDDLRAAARADGGAPRELATLEPSETRAIAAVVLVVDLLRRETWSDEVELSETLHRRYPRGAAPEPSGFAEASYQMLDDARAARVQRCSSCFVTSGYTACIVCYGSGHREPVGVPCEGCEGKGKLLCGACDGTGKTVRATVVHVNDHPVGFRRAFLPELPDKVAPRVEALLATLHAPPDALRFELAPTVVGSAYRGASAVRMPEFHGHAFGDALDRAVAAVADIPRYGHVVRSDVRAYAWPLLTARFLHEGRAREFVVFRDEAGAPHWIEAASPLG